MQEYSTEKPLITQAHLILLENAWIKLYREKNVELYTIANHLNEILIGNKLLQMPSYLATNILNILISQIQKYYFDFNNQIYKFELKEVNTIKKYLQNSKKHLKKKQRLLKLK